MKTAYVSFKKDLLAVIPDNGKFYSLRFDDEGNLKRANRLEYIDTRLMEEIGVSTAVAGGITSFIDVLYDMGAGNPTIRAPVDFIKNCIEYNGNAIFGDDFGRLIMEAEEPAQKPN